MSRKRLWLLAGLALLLAACGGGAPPQDLTLSGVSPNSPTVAQGGNVALTLTLASQNGFQGQVSLSVTENGQTPSWLSLSPTSTTLNVPKGGQAQVGLQVQVAGNAPTGAHALKLRVAYAGKAAERDLTLTVSAPSGGGGGGGTAGTTWTVRNLGNYLSGVAYGNGTFVAVGYNGTILTSPDGAAWTARTSGTSHNLSGVAYGNGTFVAVGYNGTILTSPDGAAWTARTSGTTRHLSGVAYGNGTFVAVGYNYTILTSP